VVQNPPNNRLTPYYKYNNGYVAVAQLDPGNGIWVKVNDYGILTMQSSANFLRTNPPKDSYAAFDKFSIADGGGGNQDMFVRNMRAVEQAKALFDLADSTGAVELPPDPPPGYFSARFATHNFVQPVEPAPTAQELPIELRSVTYPATVKWSLKQTRGVRYELKIGELRIPIGSTGSHKIESRPKDGRVTIIYQTGGTNLPLAFNLEQNYPNPFNPQTTIRYSVPEDGHVRLAIYSVLGQQVKVLVDGVVAAGYRSVSFDASGFSSGVYFYRMEARRYSQVRKLLVMK
jgi:hypothetical protein